jgi:hypothetical protein
MRTRGIDASGAVGAVAEERVLHHHVLLCPDTFQRMGSSWPHRARAQRHPSPQNRPNFVVLQANRKNGNYTLAKFVYRVATRLPDAANLAADLVFGTRSHFLPAICPFAYRLTPQQASTLVLRTDQWPRMRVKSWWRRCWNGASIPSSESPATG